MARYYYTKTKRLSSKVLLRVLSILIFTCGLLIMLYIFFPLISWQLYFAPIFASNDFHSPIPKTTIVNNASIGSLLSQASTTLTIDYLNAQNWFPNAFAKTSGLKPKVPSYTITIPKLKIKDALVSTIDNDLASHLVNYRGTAIPPENGNAVIFGHSTLPQLFDQNDYKTIFATVHNLRIGNDIIVTVDGIVYRYKVTDISIVDSTDTRIFEQNYHGTFLTLVTCTPPGTVWKRLIITSRLTTI